ncbi:hypothetical protein PWT90_01502 [Aphanocladium album]|nr:hypothetical protein PWT90_01502 [Aphanocladium album]
MRTITSPEAVSLAPTQTPSYLRAAYLIAAWSLVLRVHHHADDVKFDVSADGRKILHSVQMRVGSETSLAAILSLAETQLQNVTIRSEESAKVPQPIGFILHYAQNIQPESFVGMECQAVTQESVLVQLKFSNSAMESRQAEIITCHFKSAVSQLVSLSARVSVSSINLCTEADMRLMQEVNGPPVAPFATLIHEIIRDKAIESPEAIAVDGWDACLTYDELMQQSLKLAAELQVQGVSPETIVPILFERSTWAIVAILAVLRAGGAVMAMETGTPEQRLKQMLEKAGVTFSYMLCSSSQKRLCTELGFKAITVSKSTLEELSVPSQPLKEIVMPENRAIIQHTSGSTGFQKGIELTHQSYCTSAKFHGPALGIGRKTRIYQFSAFSFDICLSEILTGLICGACICIPTATARTDELPESITALNATWIFMTNSVARIVDPAQVKTLKTVVCGGERVDKSVIAKWSPVVNFFEVWGPSETSVYASSVLVKNSKHDPANIGRPLGCRLWVVDSSDDQKLAPWGAVGELCIESPTVARGYLNLPDKTTSAFKYWPKWLQDGHGAVYKSGDLARFAPDGSLRFMGRVDSQIKHHGQRIELEEIEHTLSAHSDVQSCVVVYPKRGPYSGRLVSIFELRPRQRLRLSSPIRDFEKINAIKKFAKEKLPRYMTPNNWLIVKSMPLNQSTKEDRKVLQQELEAMQSMHLEEPSVTTSVVGTENSALAILKNCAGDLLNREVSVHHSFISQGGDSISAMQLVGICRQHGLQLSTESILTADSMLDLSAKATLKQKPESNINFDEVLGLARAAAPAIFEEIGSNLETVFPCSPTQEGILISQSKNPQLYRTAHTFRIFSKLLSNSLDISKLGEAWDDVVARHQSLRSTFAEVTSSHGSFVQVVQKSVKSTFMSHKSMKELMVDLGENRNATEPPHRFRVSLQPNGSVMCKLEMSHTITDAVSVQVILEELAMAYEDMLPTESGPLYSDYVSYLSAGKQDDALAYWTTYLEGVQPCQLRLPSEEALSVTNAELASVDFEMKLEDAELRKMQERNLSIACLIQAAWALVLSDYTSRDEVCFAYISASRHVPIDGINSTVGAIVATLPCRLAISRAESATELLKQVKDDMLNGIGSSHVSLTKVIHNTSLTLSSMLNSVVSVAHDWDLDQPRGTHLSFEEFAVYDPSDFEISLSTVVGKDNALSFQIDYWTNSFSESVVNRLKDTFQTVTSALARNLDTRLDNLNRLSSHDSSLIQLWNQKIPGRMDNCIHRIISGQAVLRADKQAIVSWDGDLSYDELDRASDKMASFIQQRVGTAPDTFIPICFEKSVWAITAMLAVLKAGSAFALLDPSHPTKRLQVMCDQLEAKAIIASQTTLILCKELTGLEVLECSQAVIQQLEATPIVATAQPAAAAYVVFTSGTTGQPKAIVTEHAAYCSAAIARAKSVMRDHNCRHLQYASYSFDTCLEDILTTLMVGGTVCIPSEDERMNDLSGAMSRMMVTSAEITPTVANMIKPSNVPSLRTLLLGGEAVTAANVQCWADRVELINSYGPAECSVTSVVAPASPPTQKLSSTIGRGQGVLTWLVDPSNHNHLVQIGAVGELILEGPGLARGYLGNEEMTMSSFITNPEWLEYPDPQRRFYKTGDLVQYLPDGQILYLGRKDHQVKLYGQRIELSEIDAVFTEVADLVAPACSILCRSRPLIALFFVVEPHEAAFEHNKRSKMRLSKTMCDFISRARARLAQRLPSYMIPAAFIPISQLPTTISGKIDRHNLQEILLGLSTSDIATLNLSEPGLKQAPTTPLQRQLHGLWCKVLNGVESDKIGIVDNFFHLGGDSILAMNLAAAGRAAGLPLKVSHVFAQPILQDMAACLSGATENEAYTDGALNAFDLIAPSSTTVELFDDLSKHSALTDADIEDVYPCTPFQEGLMAASMKQDSAYRACLVFELEAGVELTTLEKSWQTIVATEPILRTRIVHLPRSNAVQVVLKKHKAEFFIGSSLQSYVGSVRSEILSYDCDLSRYAIISENGKQYFVWTAHHAIYDAHTISMILQRVTMVYKGEILSPMPQFNRFVGYVQHQLLGANWKEYWQRALDGCQPLEFPARLSINQPCATTHLSKFRMDLASVQDTPRRDPQLTAATIVRAAWALVISQYTETPDVVFGETHVGRSAPIEGIMELAGPTLATVPVRIDVSRYTTVGELLNAVQRHSLESMFYEHVGLQNIRALDTNCQLACEFQNLLVIQPPGSNEKVGLFKEQSPANLGFHNYPLVLDCALEKDHLVLTFTFDSAVIAELHVERLSGHLQNVIRQLHGAALSFPLSQVTLFGDADQKQISEWNCDDPVIWEQDRLIHDVFAEQVLLHSDAEAVCGWDRSLTYKQLDQESTILAQYLVSKYNIGPEVLVPLVFSKCSWVPVAMLAVLKSGAGFVPIDPAQPPARLLEIITQAKPRVVLLSADIEHLPSSELPMLKISQSFFDHAAQRSASEISDDEEGNSGASAASSDHRPTPSTSSASSERGYATNASPTNVAYVIFTSGSTGKPKGVVIEHKNFLSGVLGPRQVILRRSPWSRVLQFASLSFDTSLEDILTTLMFGGTICIPSEHQRMNDIQAFIRQSRANTAHLTPSFINTLTPEAIPSIEFLALGGERMTPSHVDTWAHRLDLRNAYGPTETSITSTVSQRVTPTSNFSDIGKGVAALIWIANPDNIDQLTPVGLVGEMLVEGALLAREYLNDPAKTAASFITSPAWASSGTKLRRFYRTGDLCRYGEDGTILYIGRRDNQVKIYGQRTELGEVEDNIKKVLARPMDLAVEPLDLPGQHKTLIAFICLEAGLKIDDDLNNPSSETIQALQEALSGIETRLSDSLPKYMIPSRWIPLQSLPTTVSKKTDRKKLAQILDTIEPERLQVYSLARSEKTQPISSAERQMQDHWAQVMGVKAEEIGRNESFFKAGGDSIMAVRLVSILRETGVSISVADILNSPDLASLAVQMEQVDASDARSEETNATPAFSLIGNDKRISEFFKYISSKDLPLKSVQDAYPTTALQESLISLSAKDAGAYVSSSVWQLPSSTEVGRFQKAWERVVALNEILRTKIVSFDAEGMVQVVMKQNAGQWHNSTSVKDYLRTADLQLDIKDDLINYALIRDDEDSNLYFVLTMHHAVYDGWSIPHLLRQVDQAYRGQPIVKPPPFSNFVQHLQSYSSPVMKAFWAHKLDSSEKATDIPSFQSLSTSSTSNNTSCVLSVTMPLEIPADYHVSQSIFIRAAWSLLIHWYTGGSLDVTFGTSIAGRNANVRGIESMVGPTLTTIPIRVRLQLEMTLKQLCQELMDDMLDTIPYEHIGLQNIQAMNADLKRLCNFNSLLVFQPPSAQLADDSIFARPQHVSEEGKKAELPVVLECTPQSRTLDVRATFDPAVISEKQMSRVLKTLEHALSELAINGDKPLGQIKQVSDADQEEVNGWNGPVPIMVQDTVQTALEESLQAHSTSEAVFTSAQELTYREVEEDTRRVSAHLHSLGVGPGSLVMLLLEKSKWHTIAVVSVLRAGGAIVPLDPFGLPEARLQYIASQTEAKIMVVSDATTHLVPDMDSIKRVQLSDAMIRELEMPAQVEAPRRALPTSPMYIIFTSGTTGLPKGVITSHQAYMSVLQSKYRAFKLGSSSRILQFTSHAFDVTVDGILVPLLCGGCVCVPDEQERLAGLDNFILQSRANHTDITPSSASIMNEHIVTKSLTSLLLGGEKMGKAGVEKWADKVHLINAWGATETCNTILHTDIGPSEFHKAANIGKAFHAFIWIVNPNDYSQLSPIGAIGEMCIHGPGLADGYIKNPERTQAVFVQPPDFARHGLPHKMYKTGDLVRYEDDGSITFVGRKDRQIKVRGLMVEPAEVEQRIQEMPNLVSAHFMVDLAPKGLFENDTLVLYMSTKGDIDHGQFLRQIGNHLSISLPQYMIPAWLLPISEMPLTVNGKLDRPKVLQMASGLDKSSYVEAFGAVAFAEPQTTTELQMQSLWANILKIDSSTVGRLDNFFHLGGDSIIAMRLTVAARDAGLRIGVQDIFKQQTLERIAQVADGNKTNPIAQGRQISQANVSSESFGNVKERLQKYFGDRLINEIALATDWQTWCIGHNSLASGGWRNTFILDLGVENVDRAQLQSALHSLVRRHTILRTSFLAHMSKVYQVVMEFREEDYPLQDLRDMSDSSLRIGDPPLGLFFDGSTGRLHFRVSHAQYDGLSLPMVYRDLNQLYHGKPLGAATAFYEYSKATQASELAASEAYWSQTLAGAPLTSLVEHKAPSVDNLQDAFVSLKMPPIQKADKSLTATPATILKTAWAMTLSKLLGTPDVVFGALAQTRTVDLPDSDSIIGPCLNIIPVRATIHDDFSREAVLDQIQEQHINSMSHTLLGFSSIIERCTNWPAWARFSSVVQYQNISQMAHDGRLSASEKKMQVGVQLSMADSCDAWVMALPYAEHLEVRMQFCTSIMSRTVAQQVLELLCANISHITTSATVAEELSCDVARHFPLSAPIKSSSTKAPLLECLPETYHEADKLVRNAWQEVVGDSSQRKKPFWDIWGCTVAASQLARCYSSSCILVTPEDIYAHPTMDEQPRVISKPIAMSEELIAKYPSLKKAFEDGDAYVECDDGREAKVMEYIYSHPDLDSMRGNPEKIIEVMDEFSGQKDFLISVGFQKKPILRDLIATEKPNVGVELGGYLGYSAILFADQMRRNAAASPEKGLSPRLWSLEASPVYAAFVMSVVDLAGLSDIVKVITGPAEASLRRLHQSGELKHADFLFLDHKEELYTADLKVCEELGIVGTGSIVVADNVGRPGAPDYREYVRGQSHFETKAIPCFITPGDLPDEIDVSRVLPK